MSPTQRQLLGKIANSLLRTGAITQEDFNEYKAQAQVEPFRVLARQLSWEVEAARNAGQVLDLGDDCFCHRTGIVVPV